MDSIEILQRIVAADKTARERYEAAKRQNASADTRSEKLRHDLAEQAMDRARKDVEDERQRLLDEADAEAGRLSEENEQKLAEMREMFSAHREEYAEKMFRMAVGTE